MSWRQSGSFRPKNSSSQAPRPNNGSGPPLLDPILQVIIVTSLVVGLVGLGLMAAFGGSLGQGGQTVAQPAQPAARPTAPPMATAAPAAANPTAAPAAPATIPTEPLGPALATGSGTAITIGTDAVQLIFDQTSVSAPNGLITLTFRNLATAVQHNWVLVNGDDTVAEGVNNAARRYQRASRRLAYARSRAGCHLHLPAPGPRYLHLHLYLPRTLPRWYEGGPGYQLAPIRITRLSA